MRRVLAWCAAVVIATGCGDAGGPEPGDGPSTNVQVSFATQAAASPLLAADFPGFFDDTITANGDTIVLTSVEIVLREVELKRASVSSCDVEPQPDGCEEFEAGPFLVFLPLDGGPETTFEIPVDTGTYVEIEFDIHKVSDDDPEDAEFLAAHPDLIDKSIRVIGTFNGAAFVYESDLNVEQELDLSPPLVLDGTVTTTNVTIFVEVDSWFRDENGALVDPATGNDGGANENLIRDNIRDSIEAFEDADRDGGR